MHEKRVLETAREIIGNHKCCSECGKSALAEFMAALTPYVGPRVLEALRSEMAPPGRINLMDVEL